LNALVSKVCNAH